MSAFDVDVIVHANNDEIEAVACYVLSLTATDQARFIERLASLVALVAERQAQACPVGGSCTNRNLCASLGKCVVIAGRK